MRNAHSGNWNRAKNTEKHGKWELHTVRPGICWENWKKVENENCTLWDLEYGENTEKCGKWDTQTLGPGIWRENWNLENETHTL